MMRVVWASQFDDWELNQGLTKWAASRIFRSGGHFGPCCTMGVFDGDTVQAVAVYHNYDRKSGVIEISSASDNPRWLTRHVIDEMFGVPFDRMGCQVVVIRTSAEREKSPRGLPRMLESSGFQKYRIPRLRGRCEDELIFTLTDDDWRTNRFNKRHHNGQELSFAA